MSDNKLILALPKGRILKELSPLLESCDIIPETDSNGVLQDVHWSAGLVGYFPTYSLGNLYASQFFDAAQNELGNLDAMFRQGEFVPLKEWLNKNVHEKGKCLSGPELGQAITGKELSHELLIQQLRAKVSPIYGLK